MDDFFNRHPELRSAARVWAYTFIASVSTALLKFMLEVNEWATQDGHEFPSLMSLGRALVAALTSLISGAIAYAYNKLPSTKTAHYEPGPEPDPPVEP